MKERRNLKEGNSHPLKCLCREERRVRGNEDDGVCGALEEEAAAVIVLGLFTQTVSSYLLLPSLLIFTPKMFRQEYKADSAGSDDFGQISLLLLLNGSKCPSSHSGPGLERLLHHLPLYPSPLLSSTFRLKVDLSNRGERFRITLWIIRYVCAASGAWLQFRFTSSLCLSQHLNPQHIYCPARSRLNLLTGLFISVCPLSQSWFSVSTLYSSMRLHVPAVRKAMPCCNVVDHFSFPSSFSPLGATLLTRKPIPTLLLTNIHVMTCNQLRSPYRLALSSKPAKLKR